MHYIVDGYNVIRKTPFLDHEKLKDARAALLEFIEIYRPHGSANNTITVVFDGREGYVDAHVCQNSSVIFSRGQSADELIVALVERSANPRSVRVISDDKELTGRCRVRGAQSIAVKSFVDSPRKKIALKQHKADGSEKLTYVERRTINEEMRKIWLKEAK